jgi:hypothetical protein
MQFDINFKRQKNGGMDRQNIITIGIEKAEH